MQNIKSYTSYYTIHSVAHNTIGLTRNEVLNPYTTTIKHKRCSENFPASYVLKQVMREDEGRWDEMRRGKWYFIREEIDVNKPQNPDE